MGITFGDYLIDSGHNDITPEQEREIEAREECERLGNEVERLKTALRLARNDMLVSVGEIDRELALSERLTGEQ